ncbi:MAG: sodium:solute symporter family protein [Kiritimatiellae bacterium]|nr:sodium:solute symporter family protein [Kiritimatiellia bacterium]
MTLNAIVVLVYLLSMIALGIYLSRYVKKEEDFNLAGRALNKWVIAGTVMATNVAAIYLVGPAGAAYKGGGVSVLLIAWTGNMIAAASALFFVPRLRRLRITTVSEFLETRYGLGLRLLPAALWIVYYALFSGNAMYTLSIVLAPVLKMQPENIIFIVTAGVIIYCFFSGLVAAAYSSVIQSFVMILGGLILLPLSLKAVGGLSGFVQKVPDSFFVFWKAGEVWPTWKDVIMFTLLGLPYWCTSQYMLQRCFAGRSVRDASKGLILAAILTGPLTLSYIIPGICGAILYSGQDALARGDAILPRLLVDVLPAGLGGLIIAALVAASNSTASALLNSLATLTEHDFYRRFVPGRSPRDYLWIGRMATLIGGLLGLNFAFNVERLGGIIQANFEIMSFFEPPIFVIVAAALFWPRTNTVGAASTIVGGVGFSGAVALMTYFDAKGLCPALTSRLSFLVMSAADRTIWAFPICAAVLIAGTWLGAWIRPPGPERRRLVSELLTRMRGVHPDFGSRAGWGGVVLAALSLLAFVGCALCEASLPKPANILIFLGLMMSFVLGCYLAVLMFVPDEKEGQEAEAGLVEASWTHKIVGSGWVWLGVYGLAAILVVVLYVM